MNIDTIKVINMSSSRSGKPVPNQFIIKTAEGEYFQSYSSTIAYYDYVRGLVLDPTYYNYSRTTAKYLHQFMIAHGINLTLDEMRKGIKDGTIVTEDLNAK